MKIGILGIQGSVEEHFNILKNIDSEPLIIKRAEDLRSIKGLIIPGGESTTLSKLLTRFELRDEIIKQAKNGLPIWGTCAGAILIAKEVLNANGAIPLKLMDIKIERNAYGGQLDSFETEVIFNSDKKIPAIFIRAPKILEIKNNVEILSQINNEIIGVKQGKLIATTFHPELTNDSTVHSYFLKICE